MDGRLKLNVAILKTLRRGKGLSQEAMARDCFTRGYTVSIATLKRAESGKFVLYRTANNIARYYNIALPELMELADQSTG
ncbi:MAG: helix-turn-helix domain-containing protein [Spongiibacteraceae bacterium]|nr:helix-turn-helix domain-containing protein [Spongiibacteraceae bacterium]